MKLLSLSRLCLILLVVCLVATCQAGNESPDDAPRYVAGDESRQSSRANFTLNKLFDFERFKRVFKKHYSVVEGVARARLFLARAFRSFVSSVSYKHRKASSYLAINHMSDWTPEEVRKIDVSPTALTEMFGSAKPRGSSTVKSKEQPREEGPLPAASLNEVKNTLREIAAMKLIAEEITNPKRKKRDASAIATGSKREISLSDLTRYPKSEVTEVGERVGSNNPHYEPPELTSFGSSDGTSRSALAWRDANFIINLSGGDFLSSVVQKASDMLSKDDKSEGEILPDEVFIDHRDECMFAPRNQGNCGSCYAFAAVAVYEWLYCKATGKKVAFSEQYIVDCGQKAGLDGCDGGFLSRVPVFIREYGMELRMNYPYRGKLDECPYESSTPHNAMGYLRIATRDFDYVDESDFEERLKIGPMVLSLLVSDAFHEYGGGVHDGAGCDEDRAHAVVLVGSGRQDNEEYWLFRNSYSPEYGEGGYYKLNKKSKHCIAYQQAYQYSRLTGQQKDQGVNAQYRSKAIKRRYQQYLLP